MVFHHRKNFSKARNFTGRASCAAFVSRSQPIRNSLPDTGTFATASNSFSTRSQYLKPVSNLNTPPLLCDPYQAAIVAGLHYSSPEGTGYRRVKAGSGFKYVDGQERTVDQADALQRIESLVIPPAWENVWVSSDPASHIQAVGWDAKGRKQYRYHPLYREVRDHVKFDRLVDFGRVLPKIRAAVRADLATRGLSRRKVIAAVVQLLEDTCIRVGNQEYERTNGSFGLTTLRNRHVTIAGSELRFRFRGKSGQTHDIVMKDVRLARIVRQCQCIAGYELFRFLDEEGKPASISSEDVNQYLFETTEGHFTAKDFRTWSGTCTAAEYFRAQPPAESATQLKRTIVEGAKHVAQRLGNRPATCKKFYIHPAIFSAYEDGSLLKAFEGKLRIAEADIEDLKPEEAAVMSLLANTPALLVVKRQRRARAEAKRRTRQIRVSHDSIARVVQA
jgi:DNA topoisomerase-1